MNAPPGLLEVTQFADVTEEAVQIMKSAMTVSLTATTKPLKRADSRIPTPSSAVTRTMMSIAGTLKIAPVDDQACVLPSKLRGDEPSHDGKSTPKPLAQLTTKPDHPIAN